MEKSSLGQLRRHFSRWLPNSLFGPTPPDLWAFCCEDYVFFIDHVQTKEDLVRGLKLLEPCAHDALVIAQLMTDLDFCEFKLALIYERRLVKGLESGRSKMPERFMPILLPEEFIEGGLLSKQFNAPLGATLFRLREARTS